MFDRLITPLRDRQLIQVEATHALAYNLLPIVYVIVYYLEVEISFQFSITLRSLRMLNHI